MGRRALNGMFAATFSGESLDPRTLALKGSPESSSPSDGGTEVQGGLHQLLRLGYSLGKLWVSADPKFQVALWFLPWSGNTQLNTFGLQTIS